MRAGAAITAITVLIVSFQPTPEASAANKVSSVESLLDRRAKAVQAHDKPAFMATVDGSRSEFAEAQSKWFDGFSGLAFTGYNLHLQLEKSPELTRKKDRERYKAAVLVADVEERFVLDGYDDSPTVNDLFLTFVEKSGGWLVASDTDTEDLGILTNRGLWEFGSIQTSKSEHFLLVFHPDQARFSAELLDRAEEALPGVARAWDRPWNQKVPVLVPSDEKELKRLLGVAFDVSNFVAFASASLETSAAVDWRLVGLRIYLNRGNFLSHSPASRQSIFAHELTHVATRSATGPFIPVWVEEGIAQLSETADTRVLDGRIRAGQFSGKLPEDWEFLTGGGTSIFLAYQKALSAMRYMRDRYGLSTVDKFYEELGAPKYELGSASFHVGKAISKTLGISLDQFEREWAADARKRAGA